MEVKMRGVYLQKLDRNFSILSVFLEHHGFLQKLNIVFLKHDCCLFPFFEISALRFPQSSTEMGMHISVFASKILIKVMKLQC